MPIAFAMSNSISVKLSALRLVIVEIKNVIMTDTSLGKMGIPDGLGCSGVAVIN